MSIEKIEANSPEAQSANIVADNLALLKALFPELVTEGIDSLTQSKSSVACIALKLGAVRLIDNVLLK